MKIIVMMLLLVLLVPVASAGDPRGRATVKKALESSVTLMTKTEADKADGGDSFCSGVFVAPTRVQTAWHCLHGGNFVDRTVVLAYNGRRANGVRILWQNRGFDLLVFEIDRPLHR